MTCRLFGRALAVATASAVWCVPSAAAANRLDDAADRAARAIQAVRTDQRYE
jgi:hypothetical protein